MQNEWRGTGFLVDRHSRSRFAIPGKAIIDVIRLILVLESSCRSARVVFIKPTGIDGVLTIARERKVYLAVLARRITDVNPQVIRCARLQAFRIEYDFLLRIIARAVIERHVRQRLLDHAIGLNVAAAAAVGETA